MSRQIVRSTYTVLTNKTLNNWPGPAQNVLLFKLPEWFINWPKTKIIKVYGCSFIFLESEPPVDGAITEEYKPRVSSRYANQFISVHSNIVRDDTTPLHIHYEEASGFPEEYQGNLGDAVEYMMTCNNFYNPKIYDVTNQQGLQFIRLWFVDSKGEVVPIKENYTDGHFTDADGHVQNYSGVYQAVIRMECELAVGN
jgi:hypothetical protein